jgi:hypothetical protein
MAVRTIVEQNNRRLYRGCDRRNEGQIIGNSLFATLASFVCGRPGGTEDTQPVRRFAVNPCELAVVNSLAKLNRSADASSQSPPLVRTRHEDKQCA